MNTLDRYFSLYNLNGDKETDIDITKKTIFTHPPMHNLLKILDDFNDLHGYSFRNAFLPMATLIIICEVENFELTSDYPKKIPLDVPITLKYIGFSKYNRALWLKSLMVKDHLNELYVRVGGGDRNMFYSNLSRFHLPRNIFYMTFSFTELIKYKIYIKLLGKGDPDFFPEISLRQVFSHPEDIPNLGDRFVIGCRICINYNLLKQNYTFVNLNAHDIIHIDPRLLLA